MKKVSHLSDKNKSSKSWSAKDALKHVAEKVNPEDKILIIRLNDKNDEYNTGFTQAGMNCSECISLMEVVKMTFLRDMGYI